MINARPFRSRGYQRGQVMILFVLAMVVILGMIAIALDGAYGFVQNRRAQNAADFAAFAAAQKLQGTTTCNGAASAPMNADIYTIVQDVVSANAPAAGAAWTGEYLGNDGNPFNPSQPLSQTGNPPSGACGLIVTAKPAWSSYLAGIIGQPQLKGFGSAHVGSLAGGPVSIASLNKSGPHVILGGGTGKFNVGGAIYLNSENTNRWWTRPRNGKEYTDAIDAKSNSNLSVFGTIYTVGAPLAKNLGDGSTPVNLPQWPLDHCFGEPETGSTLNNKANADTTNPAPPGPPYPTNAPGCGSAVVKYNYIDNSKPQINDPLNPLVTIAAPPNPTLNSSDISCPGHVGGVVQYTTTVPLPNATLSPGEYKNPVHITGSAIFGDCGTVIGGRVGDPGIFKFDKGLWIDPQLSGDVVSGTNIVLAAGGDAPGNGVGVKGVQYPVGGNVPGSTSGGVFTPTGAAGNGAPCLKPGTKENGGFGDLLTNNDIGGAGECNVGGSPLYGVYVNTIDGSSPQVLGTGMNYSMMIGGKLGKVDLHGPKTGAYGGTNNAEGLVLYQDPGTPANFGFDAMPNDGATVNVTGVVYNASLNNYGIGSPEHIWSPYGAIPAYPGGILQTGYGASWDAGGNLESTASGKVTITGTSVVDDFNTDGATTILILGKPYNLPGGSTLSLLG